MFGKIRDLERYKNDQKRFNLAIEGTYGDAKAEGQRLLEQLHLAVEAFDGVMENLIIDGAGNKMDHAQAQRMILEAKKDMENWVNLNAPGVHVDTTSEIR